MHARCDAGNTRTCDSDAVEPIELEGWWRGEHSAASGARVDGTASEEAGARRVRELQREVATLEEMRAILGRIQRRMLRRLATPDGR